MKLLVLILQKKAVPKPGVLVNTCNPSTCEAEAGVT
jgi:hypothetical protein